MADPTWTRFRHYFPAAAAAGYVVPEGDVARKLRDAAVCARIPARIIKNQWHYSPTDIHEIAAVLKLQRASEKVAA